ncbi:MAG TPA: DNA polymerase III subunit delta' [Dehalococcoidia bacterium]|nr:DNA polymerase III subunit delta' [Dehalococcoidia bacterium]
MWQILGHPKAITLLERSIQRGRLSHAYLFVGPPHVGKMTLALDLAQAVNCQAEDVPCSECASCRRIASGKHADVQIIGLISEEKREIGIKQIWEMQSSASLPPYEGKQKVFIIEKADLLSHEASNSLLKTLEEPLPGVLFILLTARERLLLPTIISRCQRVELRPLPFTTVEEVLHQRYGVSEQKTDLLAHLSGGCLGWALLAMQDERLLEERAQRLNTLIALTGASSRQRLAYAAKLAAQFSQAREEMEKVLALWVNWWHDLLLVKGGNGKSITNTDQESAILQQAKKHSLRQIKDFIHHLRAVNKQLEQNANPRLALEVLMLNMP